MRDWKYFDKFEKKLFKLIFIALNISEKENIINRVPMTLNQWKGSS